MFPTCRSVAILAHCLVAMGCVLPAGCMLPYGYPHISHVAGVEVNRETGDVHAFRVDARVKAGEGPAETDAYRLGRVPLPADGRVSANTKVDFDYGMYLFGGGVNHPVHYSHHTETRLYRRGYQLIEVPSGTSPAQLDWKTASDLLGQEKALDDLMALPRLQVTLAAPSLPPGEEPWSTARLSPGSTAPAQRDALLFAAGEYERLLVLVGESDSTTRDRLIRKARELRACAAR